MGFFKKLIKKVKKMKLLSAKNILPLLAVAGAAWTGGLSLGGGFSGALSSVSALGELSSVAGIAMSGVGRVVRGDIGRGLMSVGKVATTAGLYAMGGSLAAGGVHGAATGLAKEGGTGLVTGGVRGVKSTFAKGHNKLKDWVGFGQSVPGSTTPMKGSEVNDVTQITKLDSDAIGPEAFGVPQGTGTGGTPVQGEGRPSMWKAATGELTKGLDYIGKHKTAFEFGGAALGFGLEGAANQEIEDRAHELALAKERRLAGERNEAVYQQMVDLNYFPDRDDPYEERRTASTPLLMPPSTGSRYYADRRTDDPYEGKRRALLMPPAAPATAMG